MSIAETLDAVRGGTLHSIFRMDDNFTSQTVRQDQQKAVLRAWLQAIVDEHGKPPTLQKKMEARGIFISASTLYRMLDEDDPTEPDLDTIRKIATAFQKPLPLGIGISPTPQPEAQPEAIRLEPAASPECLRATSDQSVWQINSRAIELAGYLPGDYVLFDSTLPRRAGDIVLAQLTDRSGRTETVIRIYDAPYLITRTADPSAPTKPLLIDDDRVWIWGTMARAVRVRREG